MRANHNFTAHSRRTMDILIGRTGPFASAPVDPLSTARKRVRKDVGAQQAGSVSEPSNQAHQINIPEVSEAYQGKIDNLDEKLKEYKLYLIASEQFHFYPTPKAIE